MKNKIGMNPINGHRIQGRSSEEFLDSKEILDELNLKGNESIMDAGCGDGHIAIKALEYIDTGKVYALDAFEPSIEDLIDFKEKNNLERLIPILSNIAERINLDKDSLDVVLMVNVFHGFKAARNMDEAILELKRVIKPNGGRIAIMDYKKQDVKHGPPYAIRSSPEELEEAFKKYGLRKTYLNNDIGEDIPEGRSHFFLVFEK